MEAAKNAEEAPVAAVGVEDSEIISSIPDKCHSLRLRSIRKRLETERNQKMPPTTRKAAGMSERRPRERAAPLSKYRRKTANARERQRMHEVNLAFERLKTSIPHHKLHQIDEKKDTKLTTLRCAISYINALSQLLDDIGRGKSVSPEYFCTDAELGIQSDSDDADLQGGDKANSKRGLKSGSASAKRRRKKKTKKKRKKRITKHDKLKKNGTNDKRVLHKTVKRNVMKSSDNESKVFLSSATPAYVVKCLTNGLVQQQQHQHQQVLRIASARADGTVANVAVQLPQVPVSKHLLRKSISPHQPLGMPKFLKTSTAPPVLCAQSPQNHGCVTNGVTSNKSPILLRLPQVPVSLSVLRQSNVSLMSSPPSLPQLPSQNPGAAVVRRATMLVSSSSVSSSCSSPTSSMSSLSPSPPSAESVSGGINVFRNASSSASCSTANVPNFLLEDISDLTPLTGVDCFVAGQSSGGPFDCSGIQDLFGCIDMDDSAAASNNNNGNNSAGHFAVPQQLHQQQVH